MSPTTIVRNADWVIAWDAERECHQYLKAANVVFQGDRISQVGGSYSGPVDREIDGRELLVMPGLINIHSHPMSEAMTKGFAEDEGNPRMGMSGLYDLMAVYEPDEEGMLACAEVAYAELLMSGVTTLVDLSVPYPGWLDLIARSGLRGCLAPMFRSARWYTDDGHAVRYHWAEDGGAASLAGALALVDQARGHPSGRLSAMISPAQADTCTPELLKQGQAAARERGLPLQIHAAQSVVEFNEMTRRHGVTSLRWLDQLGLLGSDTIIAHAIFIDDHSWIFWGEQGDLDLLAARGCTVAHCPNVFVRHGMLLEHFGRYRAAGINLGIGTDTYPHNMLEELRFAALLGRISARKVEGARSREVFEAAMIGGARALQRDDIGRLAPGAKADLVLVDVAHPAMMPVRDPLRSLIFMAAERAVRDVYVDGRQVVADGKVLTLDYGDASLRMQDAARRAEPEVPKLHWSGRRGEEIAPLAFPLGKT